MATVDQGEELKRIGITFGRQNDHRYGIHVGYSDALSKLNALSILVSAAPTNLLESPESEITLSEYARSTMDQLDGLIISGGWDVDPALYGQDPHPKLETIDPQRDRFEMAMIEAALSSSKKILAICRGMQILNVFLGGSLYQDLVSAGFHDHSKPKQEYDLAHAIRFESNSELGSQMKGAEMVNTLHHQAVKDVGKDVHPVAYSPDGVIEAIEGNNLMGIQWHPERLFQRDDRHLAGFEWVVS
ncbi:putative glutamine amidotransferasec [Acidithrix ferrooxidans]|uniref:Putative glutamine amidotransferasec n=1 Tax=Acidithrix ferrooxidans TaxID=1280514 RepID=A0A0D8HJK3_9ACTN|nr:putative glutamine amidotransferasec [Acidithrix ferrooxidans]